MNDPYGEDNFSISFAISGRGTLTDHDKILMISGGIEVN